MNFLGSASVEEFKFSLVAWYTVCSCKALGGLGIRQEALIQSSCGNGYGGLGMRPHIYGDGLLLLSMGRKGVVRRGLKIQLEGHMGVVYVGALGQVGAIFCCFVYFRAGDGTHVWFQHDIWCGNHSLKELHLDSYACSMLNFIQSWLLNQIRASEFSFRSPIQIPPL